MHRCLALCYVYGAFFVFVTLDALLIVRREEGGK